MTRIFKLVAASLTVMTLVLTWPIAGMAADAPEALVGHAAAGVATVEAIDRETRQITLKGDGGSTTITAGPEVRNFDRINRGDLVVFEYFEGLVVTLVPAIEGVPARQDAVAITRAARGDRPGAAAAQVTTAEGKVKAIDREHRIVLVEGPRRTVALKVADGVDLQGVSVGDAVLARYEAAYAISVQPPADVDAEVLIHSTSIALGVG